MAVGPNGVLRCGFKDFVFGAGDAQRAVLFARIIAAID
jgi:hypothetical protein